MHSRIGVRLAALALVALVALACGGERRSTPQPGVDSLGASIPSPASPQASAIPATWRLVSWEPYAGVDPTDLGIGVVFLRRAEDKAGTVGTDTLVLRSAPDPSAPPIGAMLFVVSTNGVTSYQIVAPDSLTPNLVEHGYEESGVPFDSADASGRWLRGILGSAPNGVVRTGWVDASLPGVGTLRWTDQLRDRPLFVPKAERAAFFATPDSSRHVATPPGGDDGYAMHPVDVRGPWMQVRLVTPSDNCVEPDSTPRRTRTVWIRYLDDRGRPNVWYYTRGC